MIQLLVAGMLAIATAMPVVGKAEGPCAYAHVVARAQACAQEVSSDLTYRILEAAAGGLEAQLQRPLTASFLYKEYQDGLVQITYLGQNADGHNFRVEYDGGGIFVVLLDEDI